MRFLRALALVMMGPAFLTGCEVVAGIFEVGVWVGGLLVVLVVLAIAGIFLWLRRRR